jgi:hypothetical protein
MGGTGRQVHPVLIGSLQRVLDRLPRSVDEALEGAAAALAREEGGRLDLNVIRPMRPTDPEANLNSNEELLETLRVVLLRLPRDSIEACAAAAERLGDEAERLGDEAERCETDDAMEARRAFGAIEHVARLACVVPFHVGDRVRSRQSGRWGRIRAIDAAAPDRLPGGVCVRWQDTFEDWVAIGALEFPDNVQLSDSATDWP